IAVWFAETGLGRGTPPTPGGRLTGAARPVEPSVAGWRWRVPRRVLLLGSGGVGGPPGPPSAAGRVAAAGPAPKAAQKRVGGPAGVVFSAEGSPPAETALARPVALALDSADHLYVIDGNRVRSISGRKVLTVVGTGEAGYSGDGGPATAARLNSPHALA